MGLVSAYENTSRVKQFGIHDGMSWTVNKSADAAWENGVTERLIRSVKRCLLLTVGDNIFSYHELQNVFFECGNILNSRPIEKKNGKTSYLCPNDLLLDGTSKHHNLVIRTCARAHPAHHVQGLISPASS